MNHSTNKPEPLPRTREETEAHVISFLTENKETLTHELLTDLRLLIADLAVKAGVTHLPRVEVEFNVSVTEEDQKQHVRVGHIPYLVFQQTDSIMEQARNSTLQNMFAEAIAERKRQAKEFFDQHLPEDTPPAL